MHRALASSLFLCATALLGATTTAGSDPNGVPVCTAGGDQTMPVIVPDGSGGAIIAWHDQRPGAPGGGLCYAQHVNSAGVSTWAANGVALGTSGDVNNPVIAPDGGGGAYIAFGGQGTAPRIQYVNVTGTPQWGADGLTLSTATTQARELAITRNPSGGADVIVVWRQDNGAGGSSDIFGQKVDFSGALQWNPGGQALEVLTDNEVQPAVVSNGAGGMVLAYVNSTNGGVRAQGFTSNGTSAWSRTPLSSVVNNMGISIVSDGVGGAVVGWGGSTGTFVQRVSSAGLREWGTPSTGVLLSSGGNMASLLAYNNGAIVTWQDFRSGTNFNVYAQAVDGAGATHWTSSGATICTATADQKQPQIVSDGGTGSYITWYDARFSGATGTDIYVQHVAATGAAQWTTDGIPLCTAPGNQEFPTIATDNAGGAFVVWQDRRSGTDYDIYLQRVGPDASALAVPPGVAASGLAAWPNPFFDRVQMSFSLPAPADVRMSVIDIGGRVVQDFGSASMAGGPHQLQWDGTTRSGARAEPGLYFLRVSASGLALRQAVVRLR